MEKILSWKSQTAVMGTTFFSECTWRGISDWDYCDWVSDRTSLMWENCEGMNDTSSYGLMNIANGSAKNIDSASEQDTG